MAAVTTHDLPTVAGMWDGSDVEEQRRMGVDPNEEGWKEIRERVSGAAGLSVDAALDEAVEGAYTLLARAPSVLLSATLDDAAAEPQRPNMPGVTDRPNWSIALAEPLEDVMSAPLAATIAETLRAGVEA
jgi:4-alpha-glucanotransferase